MKLFDEECVLNTKVVKVPGCMRECKYDLIRGRLMVP